MSAAEKLLERMRQTLSGWGQDDFERLYTGFGFIAREGSNHTVYTHEKYPQLRATVARHNQLAKGYAKTAVRLIDQLKALEGENPDAE